MERSLDFLDRHPAVRAAGIVILSAIYLALSIVGPFLVP